MKKRILSLLCVLALCLGLLPTTALAAGEGEPDNLYVGNQNVKSGEDTTYWTTDDSGGLVKSDENANWNVKYDPTTATLTLSGATIKGGSDVVSIPYGSGIYAQGSSNQPVTLTIELIGENTITGTFGIYVNATPPTTSGTDASLVIKKRGDNGDNGSLTVTGTGNSGLHIISGTGNASLTIEDASVVASSSSSIGAAGVCVQSGAYATNSPQLSLAVKGGSLTVSGSTSGDGIQFYVGNSSASATTSLSVTDHAIVDARNGGISASRITETLPTPTPTGDNSSGIVFDGTEGTVYGDVTLDEPLTVGEGETLTIPQGSALDTNGNLTNNGTVTIENGGTLNGSDTINNTGTINVENGGNLDGTPTGTVVYAPTITAQPTDQTVTAGKTATFTVTADGGSLTYQWQYRNDNGTNWNDITGATGSSYTTDAVTLEMNNYQYQCMVRNSAGSVTSDPVTLTVNSVSVTGVSLDTTELSLYTGESKTLTAKVEPADATNQDVTWSSNNNAVATVENGTVKAVGEGEATITVTTADGGKQATCLVKVTQATYNISAEGSLDFGEAYTGYDRPTAKTVTITNTGNQTLTLDPPASTKSFEVGTLSDTQLAPNEKATFTVQPKADLAVGSHEEAINISGSNGNNTVSTSVEATFAVVDINDTSVDNKLTITSGISDGIPDTAFDTADKVKAELTKVLVQDAAYTAGNAAFYDVKLQYSLDDGATWIEATEATFPTEGITVTLPYPSGTGKDTHNFRVVHMFTETSARLGTEAGKTETPAVTKTDSGLQVTLRGLSPVVIGWDKIETPSSGGSTTPAATATPAPSDNITYYTCPSCGYHNWTATDAGYRCDNCGYLESTRQLSGYGNVKGTYTPGSGATSTAASAVPQTGDESNPVLWTVLLLVSGLALGGLAIAKRKKQQ